MAGKRKHPRHLVIGMDISAKTIHKANVEILDMSIGGCSLRGTKRFLMGGEYVFRFELTDRVISVKGSVVWERMTGIKRISAEEGMPVYTAGIEFKDVFTDRAQEIRHIIADKLKERRLGRVRIKLHDSQKAVLRYLETCVVKDMSLDGMRIETEQKPLVETVFPLGLILAEDQDPIRCKCRVVFCLEATEKMPKRYSVGVEFIGIGREETLKLEKFIELSQVGAGAVLQCSESNLVPEASC